MPYFARPWQALRFDPTASLSWTSSRKSYLGHTSALPLSEKWEQHTYNIHYRLIIWDYADLSSLSLTFMFCLSFPSLRSVFCILNCNVKFRSFLLCLHCGPITTSHTHSLRFNKTRFLGRCTISLAGGHVTCAGGSLYLYPQTHGSRWTHPGGSRNHPHISPDWWAAH